MPEEGHLYSGYVEDKTDTSEMEEWIKTVNTKVREQKITYLKDFIEYVNKNGYGSAYDLNELILPFIKERIKKKDEGTD